MTTAESGLPAAGVAESTTESIRSWALVSLVLYVISGIAYAGFIVAGGVWSTISDSVGLLLAVSLLILVLGFDTLFRPRFGRTAQTARWVGVVAMSLGIAGSIVLLSSQTQKSLSQESHCWEPGRPGKHSRLPSDSAQPKFLSATCSSRPLEQSSPAAQQAHRHDQARSAARAEP